MAKRTMRNRDLLEAVAALAALSQQDMPLRLAHKVGRSLRVFRNESELIEKLQQEYREKYLERDEDGAPVVDEAGNETFDGPAFQAEWDGLMQQEVELELTLIQFKEFEEVVTCPKCKKRAPMQIKPIALEIMQLVGVIGVPMKPRK